MRNDSQHGLARLFLQKLHCWHQQTDITTKLVDNQSLDQRALFLIEQCQCTDQRSQCAAPVNIGDQQNRRLQIFRDAHIDDVILFEIDFGRAARSFDHQCIIRQDQTSQCLFDRLESLQRISLMVFRRTHIADRHPHQNNL